MQKLWDENFDSVGPSRLGHLSLRQYSHVPNHVLACRISCEFAT